MWTTIPIWIILLYGRRSSGCMFVRYRLQNWCCRVCVGVWSVDKHFQSEWAIVRCVIDENVWQIRLSALSTGFWWVRVFFVLPLDREKVVFFVFFWPSGWDPITEWFGQDTEYNSVHKSMKKVWFNFKFILDFQVNYVPRCVITYQFYSTVIFQNSSSN